MDKLYVTDTNSVIFYFSHVFEQPSKLSAKARQLFEHALNNSPSEIKLSIPSVVFVEIFDKWLINEEFAAKFHYEVFSAIVQSPNIEIKPIEREVLENLLKIGGSLSEHDIHDKLILASAMMLNCPLITTDSKIIESVNKYHVIPSIVN
jgi:predicted nucleic acid-binding protein